MAPAAASSWGARGHPRRVALRVPVPHRGGLRVRGARGGPGDHRLRAHRGRPRSRRSRPRHRHRRTAGTARLIHAICAYAWPRGARAGLAVIKRRLLRALQGVGVALHEIEPAVLVYPRTVRSRATATTRIARARLLALRGDRPLGRAGDRRVPFQIHVTLTVRAKSSDPDVHVHDTRTRIDRFLPTRNRRPALTPVTGLRSRVNSTCPKNRTRHIPPRMPERPMQIDAPLTSPISSPRPVACCA